MRRLDAYYRGSKPALPEFTYKDYAWACRNDAEAVKEQGAEDFKFDPLSCAGIDKCKSALSRAAKGVLPNNFIEGMVCEEGCIGGAACITHGMADRKEIDNYGKRASNTEMKTVVEKALNR